ncbi:Uncharacterised protein [Mycobacteroides abscessus subsp. abscessus]|nr:Uncharacterised protein [Mycobacteroides abscessus subsp. abscessus]
MLPDTDAMRPLTWPFSLCSPWGADDDVVGADERVEAALVSPCVPHAATENAVRPANASSAPRANRGWASVWVGVIDALRDRRMGQLSVLTAAGVGLRPVCGVAVGCVMACRLTRSAG